MPFKTRSVLSALLLAFALTFAPVSTEASVSLGIDARSDTISFQLSSEDPVSDGPWLLQASSDGKDWEDLLFFGFVPGVGLPPALEVPWAALPDPVSKTGFFRAVQLPEEDFFLRDFLSQRAKWRSQEYGNYEYTVVQNFGWIFWRGTISVSGGGVSSFQTIELLPSFVETPEVPTIDRLFERIEDALAADAASINVTWHPVHGYPTTCLIDFDAAIADEEQGWTIESFSPPP